MKRSDGIILTFDANDISSFESLKYRMQDIQEQWTPKSGNKKSLYLVGNKIDLLTDQQKSKVKEEIEEWISKQTEFEITYFETSAKTGYNVKEVFQTVCNEIIESKEGDVNNLRNSHLVLDDTGQEEEEVVGDQNGKSWGCNLI